MDFASVDWRQWQRDIPLTQAESDEMWMTAILEDRGHVSWEVQQAVQVLVRRVRALEAKQQSVVVPYTLPAGYSPGSYATAGGGKPGEIIWLS